MFIVIPNSQNFRQKLQALVVIKISTHQKKVLSELCRTITIGWSLYCMGMYIQRSVIHTLILYADVNFATLSENTSLNSNVLNISCTDGVTLSPERA